MKKETLELIETTPEQAVIKVNATTPEEIARNPRVGNAAYITVTAQKVPNTNSLYKRILTVTTREGKTRSFFRGYGGYTLIGEETEYMKGKVIEYLKNNPKNRTPVDR